MSFLKRLFSKPNGGEQEAKEPNGNLKSTSFTMKYEIVWKETIEPHDRDFDKTVCCNEAKFCQAIMETNKVYSRADIEKMSHALGYSVYDNIGGAVNEKGEPICSCKWNSVLATKTE